MQTTLEYYDSMEQAFWECTVPYCLQCGSTRDTVQDDALYLGVKDPICCEVTL